MVALVGSRDRKGLSLLTRKLSPPNGGGGEGSWAEGSGSCSCSSVDHGNKRDKAESGSSKKKETMTVTATTGQLQWHQLGKVSGRAVLDAGSELVS